MPTPIKTSDPILASVAAAVPAGFLADAVDLINRSPLLQSEINQVDATPLAGGATTTVQLQSGAANGGSSSYHSAVINISTPSSFDDTRVVTVGGSQIAGQTEQITPAGTFVGLLAYELAHWSDASLGPIYNGALGGYTLEQAVATEFASEGKSGLNQYRVMVQIQGSVSSQALPLGLANGNILFNVASTPAQDTLVLQQLAHLGSAADPTTASISYLGSQFWNVPVDGGTFLSTFWNGYGASGAVDDLGIALATITSYSVSEASNGTLAGCTITTGTAATGGLTYQIDCPVVGQQQARVLDTASGALRATISTDVAAGSAVSLRVAADDYRFVPAPAATSLAVTGSRDTVDLSGLHGSVAVTLAGGADSLFGGSAALSVDLSLSPSAAASSGDVIGLGAGNATIAGADARTSVFGGASNVDYAGGGILVMGTGAAMVSGGMRETVFGGTGGVTYRGGGEYADVIGTTGSCTIQAGAGGGWYGGGSLGHNLLAAAGAGTVLDAGGNLDTLTGAAGGGAYLIAATGNETLRGGNQSGLTTCFLGTGADSVEAGAGGSVIVTGAGSATIAGGGGHDQIWGGSGAADLFRPGAGGGLEIHGFRIGTDHVAASGQAVAAVSQGGAGTTITFASGASVLLVGVQAQSGGVVV